MSPTTHLPRTGQAREALRRKGQFWTPDWIAKAMVAYVVRAGTATVFDPAVGEGAFCTATKAVSEERGISIAFHGIELDSRVLDDARSAGLSEWNLSGVKIGDFILDHIPGRYPAIVANPPYIRHHRLPLVLKAHLQKFATDIVGRPIDGRAGLHVFFLIKALDLLAYDGRLAFIVPADTCEGVFANRLWTWITSQFALEGVVTFEPQASPFPGVDTNPVILLIRRVRPRARFQWVRVRRSGTEDLRRWIESEFELRSPELAAVEREVEEGVTTGLTRAVREARDQGTPILKDYASTMRGIAPGATSFFLLTREQIRDFDLPQEVFLRAIARTRDVPGEELTFGTLDALEQQGRPSFLLSIPDQPFDDMPLALQQYLRRGEDEGFPKRALIRQRRPWYKMEKRRPPEFLFAYLGRRNVRFIRNIASVVPLTGFLCVYANNPDPQFIDCLWNVLRDPATAARLPEVAKSYGAGALKVEPRALERLPLPWELVQGSGLATPGKQLRLIRDHAEVVYDARPG